MDEVRQVSEKNNLKQKVLRNNKNNEKCGKMRARKEQGNATHFPSPD